MARRASYPQPKPIATHPRGVFLAYWPSEKHELAGTWIKTWRMRSGRFSNPYQWADEGDSDAPTHWLPPIPDPF